MKSKILSFLSLLIMSVISMSAANKTAVLSSPSESVSVLSDADGIVTLTDVATKGGIQAGSVTIQGKTCMKLSGSRQFKLNYSSDVEIVSVTLYAVSNGTSATTVGTSGDDKDSYGSTNVKGGVVKSFTLTGQDGEGLIFSGQSNAVIVVEYSEEAETAVPTITTDLSATAEATVGIAQDFTIVAEGAKTFQWYVNGAAVDGATATTFSYTATEAGDAEIYCAVTNKIGTTNSTTCTVTATAPSAAPTITTDLQASYQINMGKTLNLSIVADNAVTYQWYLDGAAIDGATSASYTFTPSSVGAENAIYCAVGNAAGTTNSATATITTVGRGDKKLLEAVFSNGFISFINEPKAASGTPGEEGYVAAENGTVKAYYVGDTAPTLTSTSVSDGAAINVDGNVITVTAEDGTTAVYDITVEAVTPLAVSANITEATFDGNEGWVKTGNAWAADKGWKFAKNADDGRLQEGRTRIYFFVEKSKSVKLINTGVTSGRNIKVYVNNEITNVTKIDKNSAEVNYIEVNTSAVDGPAMIAVISDQTGGDGGFTKYSVVAPDVEKDEYTISFSAEGATGVAPADVVVANGADATVPVNYTLYKEDYTLTGWTDGENTYAPGATIASVKKDIALTAVFTQNTQNINNRNAAVTVNWEFRKNMGVPQVGWEGNSGFLVAQAEVNGETIDVKLAIDATSGKFNNSNGDWAQVNSGTKLTVPSAKGAVISTFVMGDPTAEAVINGQSYDSFASNIASWTMTGEETTATFTTAGGTWYQWIKVVLPKTETAGSDPVEVEARTATWDFQNLVPATMADVNMQGKSGEVVSDIEGVSLSVDATNGKLAYNSAGYAQFNQNTVISVPVRHAGDVVTVVSYPGQYNYTIGGVAATDNTSTYTATEADATAGKVDIIATATSYLYSISVNQIAYTEGGDPEGPDAYDNVEATIAWAVGNETEATSVTAAVADAVSSTKVKAAATLSTTVISNYAANNGNAMVAYTPASDNPGNVADAMIEYTVKMQKGVTFKPTSVSYDAIKDGTNNATYSWSYTVDGVASDITTVSKDNILRNDNSNAATAQLGHNEAISGASAGQTVTVRFYVSGFGSTKKFALSNIKINGIVNGTPEVRTFKDFKIEFRNNPYTVETPAEGLPEGVEVNVVAYHDAQHGVKNNSTVTVPVDGPVKFTIGGCGYSNGATVKVNGGAAIAIDTKSAGCDGGAGSYDHFATYTYNVEEAATLVFDLGGYCPYFFAEQCDYIPQVDVTYYDVDGKTVIGTETVPGSSDLVFAYGADDVTVASGKAFRGWFSSAALEAVKIKEGIAVNEDLKLYAKATDIEEATVGSVWNYELNKTYFYQEDHELINMTNGSFHDGQHGWSFGSNGTLELQVAGNAIVNFSLCQYSDAANTITCVETGETINSKVAADGGAASLSYSGEATTLHFNVNGGYIHAIKVFNIDGDLPEKNAAGYYVMNSGDGAGLLTVLANAKSGDKIFLPNGLYDFGNTCLTAVPAGVSLIGQSQNDVIIKNTPLEEGIGITATLRPGGNVYMQDLSIQCSDELSKTDKAGRCVTIQDMATRNVFKNVSLLSGQDTYYSNGSATQQSYFENCYITGTVDFICGGGDIVFKNTTFYCNERNGNVIFAPATNANTKWGYVALDCVVDGHSVNNNSFNIGRDWQGSPAATLINTEFKITPTAAGYTNMSTEPLVLRFHEYNSYKTGGEAITGHNFDKLVGGSAYNDQLYLSAADAANYTLDKIFAAGVYDGVDAWDPTTQTAQATADAENIEDDAAYLVEKDGVFYAILTGAELKSTILGESMTFTIRKANGRGGFGEAVEYTIEATSLEVTVGATGWATFSAPFDAVIPEGVTAYYISGADANSVTIAKVNEGAIDANNGIIIAASAGKHTFVAKTAGVSGNYSSVNKLVATSTGAYTCQNFGDIYVLAKTGENSVGFKKANANAVVGINKAYLPATAGQANSLVIKFEDGETAISLESADETVKSAIYDLVGRRQNALKEGVNIVNSVKVVK